MITYKIQVKKSHRDDNIQCLIKEYCSEKFKKLSMVPKKSIAD